MSQVKYDPLGNFIRFLAKALVQWVGRHPYLTISIGFHIILIYALFSWGTYQFKQQQLKEEQSNIEASLKRFEEMQRKEMRKHVDNLEKMKQLLDQSVTQELDEASQQESTDADTKNKAPNTNESETSDDLLKKARDLSQAIQRLSKKIKAEDMSKLLNMSKEEAMKKIEAEEARAHLQENNNKQSSSSEQRDLAKANEEVKKMEEQARNILEKRQAQLESKEQGHQIQLALQEGARKSGELRAKQDSVQQSLKESDAGDKARFASGGGEAAARVGGPATKNSRATNIGGGELSQRMALMLQNASYDLSFFGSDISRIPFADPTNHKERGRIFGRGGQFAERVYLNSWYLIGPFQGYAGVKLFENPRFPPEDFIDLDAVYAGKDHRVLKWEYFSEHDYPFIPPDADTDSIYYGYNTLKFEQAIDTYLWFGADDDLQVWIDDQLVWRGGSFNKQALYDIAYNSGKQYWQAWNLSDGKIPVHFEKGVHKVLFKLSNGPNAKGVFASIILTKD